VTAEARVSLFTSQKEFQPALPIALVPNGRQAVVVLGATGLEIGAQVKQRPVQRTPLAQQEGDEEPPHSAVAVKESVDRLELSMRQAALQEHREAAGVVQKLLQVVETRVDLGNGRGDEGGVGQRATGRSM
jgi:hypothetical protein